MINYNEHMWNFLQGKIHRILSQLNRDYDSQTYGSFDRNYWHYKIRDFSSMILQQGMLVLYSLKAYNDVNNKYYNVAKLDEWIDGTLSFWAKHQLSDGSFNEYYPNEHGFPPTAFSLYSVGLILQFRNYTNDSPEITKAVQKAINWLLTNHEQKALNQEMAGIAGIQLCSKLPGIVLDQDAYEKKCTRFFNRQNEEGWFPEYDGPDVGYLSVTIDCLYDYYLSSHDERAVIAMNKAVDFIYSMISVSGETPVMINARNTSYIVPYGLTRLTLEHKNEKAKVVCDALFSNIDSPEHYLTKIDDRYSCHYVYQSCFRSLLYTNDLQLPGNFYDKIVETEYYYKDCGYYIRHNSAGSIFINTQKSGIINVFNKSGIMYIDYGRRIKLGKNHFATNNWQDLSYTVTYDKDSDNTYLTIHGFFSNHKLLISSMIKHQALRIMSYLLGNKIIPILKKLFIFRDKKIDIKFIRKIRIEQKKIVIEDTFEGKKDLIKSLVPAPHYSFRHVSSAGLFENEELFAVDVPWEKTGDTCYVKVLEL